MKNVYKCERCGRVFENYEDCERCESHHYTFTNGWSPDGINEKLDAMTEYKDGQEEPNVIHVVFERSYWDRNTETWKNEKRCGKYKLVSSYEAPLEITNA